MSEVEGTAARPRTAAEPERVVTQAPLVNVANFLTVVRTALVPVFLVALFAGGGHEFRWRMAAFSVFAVAALTDHVDGFVARKYGLVTDFGKLADPIADKALIGAALFGLSVLGDIPWWITIVIVAREMAVTALRFAVIRHGVVAANRGGKLKTLVQTVAIGLHILPLPAEFAPLATALLLVAVVLTVVTGVDYLARSLRTRPSGVVDS